MVEIRQVPYLSPAESPFGLEVMSFGRLRAMGPRERRAAPQRPEFHVLGVVESGTGHHTVDFRRFSLRRGSVLWIRPGQVHQLDGVEQVEGPLLLFRPDFLTPGTIAHAAADDPFGPVTWRTGSPLAALALDHVVREYAEGAGDPPAARVEVLRQLLAVAVLRLLPDDEVRSGGVRPVGGQVFTRFRAAVERDFAVTRRVADYARALGYSPRTLSRATLATAGLGAKEFVDRRVVLEAKRLLAHGDLPAARCAGRLGFEDAANFSKFFQHHTGMTPGAFRASVRPPGSRR
jgi:AraC-like DNA-binding protein